VEAYWPKKGNYYNLIVVAMGAYYFSKTNQRVFNESLYVSKGKDYVVQRVVVRIMVERKKKIVHFVFIFHLHFQGRPMKE